MRWIGTVLNFFLPGLGYIVAGPGPKRILGVPMAVAMAVLTYVELGVQVEAPALYWPMFGAVFLFNTAFAVDTYQVLGKELPTAARAAA